MAGPPTFVAGIFRRLKQLGVAVLFASYMVAVLFSADWFFAWIGVKNGKRSAGMVFP